MPLAATKPRLNREEYTDQEKAESASRGMSDRRVNPMITVRVGEPQVAAAGSRERGTDWLD